jgi:uncharacterized protein (DUF4415 family)
MKKQFNTTSTKRYAQDKLLHQPSQTDLARLHDTSEPGFDAENPPTDENFWAKATVADPGKKILISLRLDPDVLAWFKGKKGRYQTLINQVLRQYMNTHQ